MKFHNVLLVSLIVLGLMAPACYRNTRNTPPGTTPSMYRDCPRPSWVDNINCEGGLCAIGVGKSQDYGFARDKAEANGLDKLAQALEVEVRHLFEQLKEENRSFVAEDESTGFAFTTSTTQHLTAAVLSGARATGYYNDCVTGDVYALMVLDFDVLQAQLKKAVASAAEETHALNRELKEQAIDRMNAIIDQRRDEQFARQMDQ